LISGWYNDLADAADQSGMRAVLENSAKPEKHWANLTEDKIKTIQAPVR
jgi:hypothetical protein